MEIGSEGDSGILDFGLAHICCAHNVGVGSKGGIGRILGLRLEMFVLGRGKNIRRRVEIQQHQVDGPTGNHNIKTSLQEIQKQVEYPKTK